MATTNTAANIRRILDEQDRSFAWLARHAGIPYKLVLKEIKHETKPLSLNSTLQYAEALEVSFIELVSNDTLMAGASR